MPDRKTSDLPKAAIQVAFLSLFLGLGVTVVSAQGLMSQAEQPVLTALDLNADGMLSTEEVQSCHRKRQDWYCRKEDNSRRDSRGK